MINQAQLKTEKNSETNSSVFEHKIEQDQNKTVKMLRVLLWNGVYLDPSKVIFCPKTNCTLSFDRKYLNMTNAIVFNLQEVRSNDLPPVAKNQKWILHNMESPHLSGLVKLIQIQNNVFIPFSF